MNYNMNEKMFPLSSVEECILKRFETKIAEKCGTVVERRFSRLLLEHARDELKERARGRGDWSLVRELTSPEAGSRAEKALETHIRTLFEEMNM